VPDTSVWGVSEAHPVILWLMTEGRKAAGPDDFLESFAVCLRRAGIDVTRITTGVPILHPQIWSFSGLWQLGKGAAERRYRADESQVSSLDNSPIKFAYQGQPVRCRLTAPADGSEFPILEDLRRDGITDYIVLPVPFSDGTSKALSLATTRAGGFPDDQVALFEAMIPAVSFNLEIQALRRTARTLLDTYVGKQSGTRVLDGQIRRGMAETVPAVIWLCDMRGFTALSECLPRGVLIEMLNQYFGSTCEAVDANGGEVLKFIGDAMLAIFPIRADAASACRSAVDAARTARESLTKVNQSRAAANLAQISYGAALHIGDVMYGNIGSDTRLDFTVIGPAVNLTARIESMCKELDRSLLLSAAFVRASGIEAELVGEFVLKGLHAKQRIYAVKE
jgi:adenylate cyclase